MGGRGGGRRGGGGGGGRFVRAPVEDDTGAGPSSSGHDDTWVLKTAAPGGPTVPTVIPSFKGHVAFALWTDNAGGRGLLRCYGRTKVLQTLRDLPLSVPSLELAQESGVGHLFDCVAPYLNVPLLCAFVERWQPDTNTFHMPFGEMTILLHDLAYILRIPISGRPCSGEKVGKSEVADFFGYDVSTITVGGDNGGLPIYRGGGVLCEALNYHIKNTNHSQDQSTAYFWHLLGNTLFADKSGDRVIAGLLSLVREPGEVKEYAWGVGALAYLYRHLGMGSRMHVKGVAGCLTILQCWIYLHFPDFCPNPADRDHYAAVDAPLAMKYRLRACPYTARDTNSIVAYRQAIDRLRGTDVIWCPYGSVPYHPHPQTCFSGVLRFLDTLEVYQPGRCLRQLGYVQSIPPPVPPPTRTFMTPPGRWADVNYAHPQFHVEDCVHWLTACIPLD